ncbi:hypothetical protein DPMN_045840 [Dreissena polymorpha]|uniref:AIG1-type G domain-containing protein n=1 Tax=Dreissena polymorpha TaxID=45954 RepID=A0A9D4I023_DREPO|nr:hypothetical protein DPMN_045840 [Dreissena polymorpha]
MSARLRKLTVVLFGKPGNGRSSTGNTLLGQWKFDAGFSTKGVTENIQRETCCKTTEKYDVEMDVVDTPGMFDRGKFEKNALKLVDIEKK